MSILKKISLKALKNLRSIRIKITFKICLHVIHRDCKPHGENWPGAETNT